MKRTLTAIGICIVLSFAVYGISLYLGLRLTDWGHYNLRPAEGRPDLAAALESKRRLAITFYLIVYPIIACLVGLLAARRAEHHLFVAVVGVLPIFAYVLRGEGIHALPLFSLGGWPA